MWSVLIQLRGEADEGAEEVELVLVVPMIERASVRYVHGRHPQPCRGLDDPGDDPRFPVECGVAEAAGGLDVDDGVPGGDGHAVVRVGADVLDAVTVPFEQPAGIGAHIGRLRLLEAQHIGPGAVEEAVDGGEADAQRVHVPRREPEMVGRGTGR